MNFARPLLMGILNITPDSFSDGGKFLDPKKALQRIDEMIAEGADIIDIGAESTFGPESQISAEEEWNRLEKPLKIIFSRGTLPSYSSRMLRLRATRHKLSKRYFLEASTIFISVDTWKSSVAEKALRLGVQMINDVTALRGDKRMIDVLVKYQPYVCLMYSAYNTPYAGRENKQYRDVIRTIAEFLEERTNLLLSRGFPREKIIIDPGLGFFLSTDPKYSWELIDRLGELKSLGFPILIGPSMKSFLGGEIKNRLPKTLEASKKCLENGANILRVHDVKAHRDALRILHY